MPWWKTGRHWCWRRSAAFSPRPRTASNSSCRHDVGDLVAWWRRVTAEGRLEPPRELDWCQILEQRPHDLNTDWEAGRSEAGRGGRRRITPEVRDATPG